MAPTIKQDLAQRSDLHAIGYDRFPISRLWAAFFFIQATLKGGRKVTCIAKIKARMGMPALDIDVGCAIEHVDNVRMLKFDVVIHGAQEFVENETNLFTRAAYNERNEILQRRDGTLPAENTLKISSTLLILKSAVRVTMTPGVLTQFVGYFLIRSPPFTCNLSELTIKQVSNS
jgi:hypothetical protein